MKTQSIIQTKTKAISNLKMKLLISYIIANIIYINLGSYIYYTNKIIENFYYKNFAQGMIIGLILNTIVALTIFIKKKYKKNITHIFIILIAIIGTISTIYAVKPDTALYGFRNRYEGLFSILYYITILFLTSFISGKYKKVIANCIIISGVSHVIYAICQAFQLFNVKTFWYHYGYFDDITQTWIDGKEIWPTGFTTNPNFLATYMLLCLSYSIGLYIDETKTIKKIIYIMFSILFIVGILISNTKSCVVGFAFVYLYILIYCIKNKQYKKIIITTIIILTTTFIIAKLGKTTLIKDLDDTGQQISQMAKGNIDDTYGTDRIYIWKETLKIVPNHLLHGAGIDNYFYAFNGKNLSNGPIQYDKAHNDYLQILVTQGIFALISYLCLYSIIVFKGIKNSFRNKEIYLILPIIGYLVQAFFNISVIEVAPIFYMALGLATFTNENQKKEKHCETLRSITNLKQEKQEIQ